MATSTFYIYKSTFLPQPLLLPFLPWRSLVSFLDWEFATFYLGEGCYLSPACVSVLLHPGAQGHTGRVEACLCSRYYWVLHRFRTLFNLLLRDQGVQPSSFTFSLMPLTSALTRALLYSQCEVYCPIPHLELSKPQASS